MNRCFLALSLVSVLLILGAPTRAQDDPGQQGQQYVSADALTLQYFTPHNAPAEYLADAASDVLGQTMHVLNRTGPSGRVQEIARILAFGDSVVIREVPEKVTQIFEVLEQLDQAFGEDSGASQNANLEVFHYAARYSSVEGLYQALRPFQRIIQPPQTSNITMLNDRGVLVIRDTPDQIAKIRSLLEQVDVREPQVTLLCYVVRGEPSAEGEQPFLPDELVTNLKLLLPFEGFEVAAIGALRTTVAPQRSIQLEMGTQASYSLEMTPSNFDQATGELSLSSCRFRHVRQPQQTRAGATVGPAGPQGGFTTRARIRTGEYTVLGAVGADPTFVVLRVVPVE